jgi:hypothetical protein
MRTEAAADEAVPEHLLLLLLLLKLICRRIAT